MKHPRVFASFYFVLASFLMAVGIYGATASFVHRAKPGIAWYVASLASGGVTQLSVLTMRRGLRHLAMPGDELLDRDRRTPVVYLRAFATDRTTAPSSGSNLTASRFFEPDDNVERWISPLANRLGPFVCLGSPKDGLPQAGAARIYLNDRPWEPTVERLIAAAQYVVVRCDQNTPGLKWELECVVRVASARKVILVFPPLRRRGAAAYRRFKEFADTIFPTPLPLDLNRAHVARFDESWNAIPIIAMPGVPAKEDVVNSFFLATLDITGPEPEPPALGRRFPPGERLAYSMMLLGGIVGVVAALLS